MIREFTCIICPNGCDLKAAIEDGKMVKIEGGLCNRGKEYAVQEITAPKRNIATSVKVNGGQLPLASVRLSNPIPKEKIFDVMNEIRKVEVSAPTHIGQVVIKNVLGLNSDVLVTKNISK